MGDRGIEGLVARLTDETEKVRSLTAQLKGATRRRRLVALKLATAGWSERRIGAVAGVSGPGVHQMLEAARRDMDALNQEHSGDG